MTKIAIKDINKMSAKCIGCKSEFIFLIEHNKPEKLPIVCPVCNKSYGVQAEDSPIQKVKDLLVSLKSCSTMEFSLIYDEEITKENQ